VHEPNTLDSPKYPIHGVGTRAYYLRGKEGDVAEGVLQVRNDLFIIVQELPTGLKRLLSTVAHELTPTGK